MLNHLIFVRHGKPELEGCLLGSTDSKLSLEGIAQLEQSTKALHSVTRIISSPLKRCLEFASKFSTKHQLDLLVDSTWQECDFGDWDGLEYTTIAKQFPRAYEEFLSNPVLNGPPNAEKLVDFYRRVVRGVESIIKKYPGEKVLIVTHAGVIRCLVAWCLNIDFLNQTKLANSPFQRIKVDYGSITRIDVWNEQNLLPQLVSLNHCAKDES